MQICRFEVVCGIEANHSVWLIGSLQNVIISCGKECQNHLYFCFPQISCLHCCGVVAKCQQLHYVLAVKVYRVVALAVIASLMTIEKQAYSVRREGRITLTPFKYNLSKEQRFIAQRKTSMHFCQNAPQRIVNYTVK